jgi:hypothetical protein
MIDWSTIEATIYSHLSIDKKQKKYEECMREKQKTI